MKPTPLLDLWQAPDGAGAAVAALATTFVLEPQFFERDCLARFLALESVDEESGSITDTVAKIELEEKLREASITVLADRSTRADRTSLRWDLLHCHVEGGLLHAKVAVLLWENATRVIVGSANLTAAGYRRQVELALAGDLGSGCLLPSDVLEGVADELDAYVTLIPGYDPSIPTVAAARDSIARFRARIAESSPSQPGLKVALAPTTPQKTPLGQLPRVWSGNKPSRATHLSPFWDTDDHADRGALASVRKLLTANGRRTQTVASLVTPSGAVPFPAELRAKVDELVSLGKLDEELRRLHAKCLLIESNTWVAALIGSSNHTAAGLGLRASRRHRELNLWLGASRTSEEGKALLGLIPRGKPLDVDDPVAELEEEDEEYPEPLPAGFSWCRLARGEDAGWRLSIELESEHLPEDWRIVSTGGTDLLSRASWERRGQPSQVTVPVDGDLLPTFVLVTWDGNSAEWAVLADSRADLPPGVAVSDLRAHQLFAALAAGKSITTAIRELLLAREANRTGDGPIVDPLKRFDDAGSLMRRGRALAQSLAALQRRLERPVLSMDILEARLSGPLGPRFLAGKVVEAVADGDQEAGEGVFTLAELSLSVGRVNWPTTFAHVDHRQGASRVADVLEEIGEMASQIPGVDPTMSAYANRAGEEARSCLAR